MGECGIGQQKSPADAGLSLLTDQGSNLDSSEPKSDVLPVTPSVNSIRQDLAIGPERARI
jgi:hypothetical protein